jgi:ketol-acid reductoisomerase
LQPQTTFLLTCAGSTTARRGAIDWSKRFKDNLKSLFDELYDRMEDGSETQRSLDFNGRKDYREALKEELDGKYSYIPV